MVDIETFSTSMCAHIATIGAVVFDSSGQCFDEMYVRIDEDSCKELGLEKDSACLKWWANQGKEAQREVFDKDLLRYPIKDALTMLSDFWIKNNGLLFWCNGANFDEPILSNAFSKANLVKPWKYWNVRCLRTYVQGLSSNYIRLNSSHNALEDCKNQIQLFRKFNARKLISTL